MQDIVAFFTAIFDFFALHISTLLLIGGFFAGFYFIYRFFKGAPEEGEKTPLLLRVVTYAGVFIGVIMMGGAVTAWFAETYYTFTCILALVVGLALILKPIKDIPWAAVIGIIAGAIVVFIASSYLEFATESIAGLLGIDAYWLLIAAFVLVLVLCYMAFKFVEDIGKILGKFLSARPTSLAIMLLCVIEAICAYMGTSLWTLIASLF
jgi:peptidoglycan/LPS O-acetylase OafA/YrhL